MDHLSSVCIFVVFAAMASQDLADRVDPLSLSGLGDNGDFSQVIERLSDALNLNPNNFTLYSNRAAAYMRVGKYSEALADANRALELKPDWTKVRRREGRRMEGGKQRDKEEEGEGGRLREENGGWKREGGKQRDKEKEGEGGRQREENGGVEER